MQAVVFAIHLIVSLALVGVILLQRSEGGALGIGGGNNAMVSGRGAASLLTRTTAILATGFFITSLFLSWLANYERKPSSIINSTSPAPISQPGSAPQAPVGGLLDSLKKPDAPAAPSAPAAPQAPQSK